MNFLQLRQVLIAGKIIVVGPGVVPPGVMKRITDFVIEGLIIRISTGGKRQYLNVVPLQSLIAFFPRVLAGYYAKEVFSTGDKLVLEEGEGTLEAIGSLNAAITMGEDVLVVPNSQLIDKKVRVVNNSNRV